MSDEEKDPYMEAAEKLKNDKESAEKQKNDKEPNLDDSEPEVQVKPNLDKKSKKEIMKTLNKMLMLRQLLKSW